ncbi:dephospho-CoA kinase [Oerskovia flava]|uniref:dephospho-CoA kinase n=1 Tax=Oerskovia flava TaxID=2986422 RepID=UPI00223FE086|nr:dephospho-CoA kinase [Oerskovia sp. JB1-3-2]
MFRIGLTGGIAAGKSVALERLAALGAVTIDHDLLAREVVAPGSVGLDRIVAEFGAEMLLPDGSLDRSRLAAVVFADDGARERLNAIVHPEVRRRSAEDEAAAAAADPRAVVVHDIPLLVETGQAEHFHLVVVVDAPRDVRLARLVESRGLTRTEAESRLAAQADDDARLAVADVTLDGGGEVDDLRAEVDALWERVEREVAEESDA